MELEQIQMESIKSQTTESGLEVLSNNPKILAIINRFNESSIKAEDELRSEEYLGTGNHSAVWSIDNIAIKVSSDTTGRIAWKHAKNTGPENLISQLRFLDSFRSYLASNSDGYITVPEQYFAFKNKDGDYIKGEEAMVGWRPINSMVNERCRTDDERAFVYDQTKSRIKNYLSSTFIRLGLTDIGLEPRTQLHGGNILLPHDTQDIINAPVCIIDQPSKGIKGKIAESIISLIYK